jgi:hypothetical protein
MKERKDILAENLAQVELIRGNRLLPMLPRSWKNWLEEDLRAYVWRLI